MTQREGPMRVLICENSSTYAAALRRSLEHDGDVVVAGTFERADEAIEAVPRLRPDLVTMDIELPGMRGLEAVELIMSSCPVPILVLSAHIGPDHEGAAAVLAAGALAAMSKDDLDLRDPAGAAAAAFRKRVGILSRAPVIRHPRARLGRRSRPKVSTRVVDVIGICASMGGPAALARVLGRLPASYGVPILVVQHIAPGFTEGLVKWLDSTIDLPVSLARSGARFAAGVSVAPEGASLLVRANSTLALDRRTATGRHRPSGDALFHSMAAAFGPRAAAVVLTGMGSDGAEGAQAVRSAGGLVIAQDEAGSVVYGMPRAAASDAHAVLTLDEIARQLSAFAPAKVAR